MSNVFIKPASIEIEGASVIAHVPDPERGFAALAVDGAYKPRSQYWLRRLRDGDVIEADPNAVAATPAPAPAETVAAFTPCANCVTQDACNAAGRCVKAPLG
jgi:hypothetical protein